jgi:putative hemolysin
MKYIIILFFSLYVSAASYTNKSGEAFETFLYDGVQVSKIKSCEDKKCDAVKSIENTDKSIRKKFTVGPGGMNPTSPFCRAIGGRPWMLYDDEKDAVSICFFKDKSFLRSWDFFNKLFKR